MTTFVSANCWRFEPGVVLALERAFGPQVAAHVWLSPADTPMFFPSSAAVLQRYCTSPGDELRVLAELSGRANVISASLNYIGHVAGSTQEHENAGRPQESFLCFVDLGEKSKKPDDIFRRDPKMGYDVHLPEVSSEDPIALIIDAELEHSRCVAYQLTRACSNSNSGRTCRFLALTTDASPQSPVDLCTVARLLMVGGEIKNRVEVVNMSLDLGQACDPCGGWETPEATFMYSFPFFEACLDEFLAARERRQGDTPLIVAAAGNRATKKGPPRWRLGYPAVLPDVAAVTCLAGVPPDHLSSHVDCPAVGPWKPCFAEPVRAFEGPFANAGAAKPADTTSYAAAVFSGRVMGMALQERATRKTRPSSGMGKLARLVRHSDPVPVGIDDRLVWVSPIVRRVGEVGPSTALSTGGLFRHLLRDLHQSTRREYVLTGSAAFVEAWLERHPVKLFNATLDMVLSWIGDLDPIHAGPWPDDHGQLQVKATVELWGKERGASPETMSGLRLTAHPLRTWAGPLYLLQCVIPDAQLLLTTEGLLDPWRGHSGPPPAKLPRVFIPPPRVWKLNPQNRTGVAGLADGLLLYLNRLMLECLLHTLDGDLGEPSWLTLRFTNDFDDLLGTAGVLIQNGKTLSKESGMDAMDLWFGAGAKTRTPGLKRRLDRSKDLYDRLAKAKTSWRAKKAFMGTVDRYIQSFKQGRVPR